MKSSGIRGFIAGAFMGGAVAVLAGPQLGAIFIPKDVREVEGDLKRLLSLASDVGPRVVSLDGGRVGITVDGACVPGVDPNWPPTPIAGIETGLKAAGILAQAYKNKVADPVYIKRCQINPEGRTPASSGK